MIGLLPTIANRISCRNFNPEDTLSREEIDLILAAGQRAPSGCNKQPWRFIVCRKDESLRRIQAATFGQSFVLDASCAIVVYGASEAGTPEYKSSKLTELAAAGALDRSSLSEVIEYATKFPTSQTDLIKDCAMAVYSMMLQVDYLGRASCWISVKKDLIKESFKLSEDALVICALAIGSPGSDRPGPRPRLSLDEISFEEDVTCRWR